eukprot:Sspe_Gene.118879::Locus_113389_Transcript_1_1_Confidence_1.000_Length_1594::g.118879::m.118879
MEVYVQVHGNELVVEVEPHETVGGLCEAVGKLVGFSPALVKMSFAGEPLEDSCALLGDVGLVAECVVHATIGLSRPEREKAIDMIKSRFFYGDVLRKLANTELRAITDFATKASCDRELAIVALSYKEDLQNFHDSLRYDREVALAAVESDAANLAALPQQWRDDKAFLAKAASLQPNVLRYLEGDVPREIVLAAVTKNGSSLRYAPTCFHSDRGVVLAAVVSNSNALRYAAPVLLSDRSFALEAVRANGKALSRLSHFQSDVEVVKAAVSSRGRALQYAHRSLRQDIDVVHLAVLNDGGALCESEVLDNKELALAALRNGGKVYSILDQALQEDEEVVECAMRAGCNACDVPSTVDIPRHLALLAVQRDGCELAALPSYRDDREVVMAAVRQNGLALEHASLAMQKDREVLMAAVAQHGAILFGRQKRFPSDEELLLLALDTYTPSATDVPLLLKYKSVAAKAASINRSLYEKLRTP